MEGRFRRNKAYYYIYEAGVPLGPCGYDELTRFALAPYPVNYQIVLVDADRAYLVRAFGRPSDKQLVLLHDKEHYDVITSLPGFFGTSHVCAHCFTPYDNVGQHRCQVELRCRSCLQPGCPDFTEAHRRGESAQRYCPSCGRHFFGDWRLTRQKVIMARSPTIGPRVFENPTQVCPLPGIKRGSQGNQSSRVWLRRLPIL